MDAVARRLYEQGIEDGIRQGIEQNIKQSIEQSIRQGIEQSIRQGIEQGIAQGIAQGEVSKAKKMALSLHESGVAEELIARAANVRVEMVRSWIGL